MDAQIALFVTAPEPRGQVDRNNRGTLCKLSQFIDEDNHACSFFAWLSFDTGAEHTVKDNVYALSCFPTF